jgi:hypothetical protein
MFSLHSFPILLASLALPITVACAEIPESQVAAARERWDEDIAKLLERDREETHPAEALLFLGSSSIRRWGDEIQADMAPWHPINRGYGGAKFADLVVLAESLMKPHQFKGLLIFVGNDVTGKDTDATPEQVADWFRQIAKGAHSHQPEAAVFCIEITPTESRWPAWPAIQQVNAALKEVCAEDPRRHFIPTASAFLGAEGTPNAELFVGDKLHLSRVGYEAWSGLLKTSLEQVLGPPPARR